MCCNVFLVVQLANQLLASRGLELHNIRSLPCRRLIGQGVCLYRRFGTWGPSSCAETKSNDTATQFNQPSCCLGGGSPPLEPEA